jgi:hypothetical protein
MVTDGTGIDIIGNSGLFSLDSSLRWMTANGNTGMILPGPVIPAKAGIQSQYKSCKNLLEFAYELYRGSKEWYITHTVEALT